MTCKTNLAVLLFAFFQGLRSGKCSNRKPRRVFAV